MAMSTLALFLVCLWRAKAESNGTTTSTTSSAAHEDNDEAHDWNVGLALLASLSFMMLLHYGTNWRDPDIRRYTNEIICSTVGIFCAVLMFQTANGAIEYLHFKHGQENQEVILRGAIVIVLYTVMQLSCYKYSNMFMSIAEYDNPPSGGGLLAAVTECSCRAKKSTSDKKRRAEFMFHTELNLATHCTFWAHMTGFANIAMWVHLHEKEYFSDSWQHDALIPVFALVWITSLRVFFKRVRICLYRSRGSIQEKRIEQWLESARDAETDVTGLSLSYLIVQNLRIAVGKAHLNAEGREEWDTMKDHSGFQMVALLAVGIGFAVLAWIFLLYGDRRGLLEGDHSHCRQEEARTLQEEARSGGTSDRLFWRMEGGWRTRAVESAVLVSGMCFAWCTYSSTNWMFSSGRIQVFKKTSCGLAISHALFLTIFSFGGMWLVDKIDDYYFAERRKKRRVTQSAADRDSNNTSEDADNTKVITKGIGITIRALGVLVGFAWEQSFDLAVEAVAIKTEESSIMHWKLLTKMLLAVSCIIIVAPAWRMYLQPMVTHKGWRFGFVAHHVIETAEELMISSDDPRAEEEFLEAYRVLLHELQTLHHKSGNVPELNVTCKVFDEAFEVARPTRQRTNPQTTEMSNSTGFTSHGGSAA